MISAKDLKDLFGETSPERVILKAHKLASHGKSEQAVAGLREAIGRLGEVPDLRVEMATLQLSAGRPREAADSLRALLKADSSQIQRVEEFIDWARTQFPDIEALHEPLAEGHIAKRSYAAAVDCLERINKKTLEAGLESRLANLNRFLEKGTLVPKSALPTLYFAALAYEAIGDWQRSLEAFRRILAASPTELPAVEERLRGLVGRNYKNTSLRLAYAELLESMGQRDRACEEHLKALEIDPRCASHVGRYVAGLQQSAPEDAGLLWASARVRMAEGKVEEALEICTGLVDSGSHLPDIDKLLEDLTSGGKESVDTLILLAKVAVAQGKVARALSAISSAIGNDAGERGIRALEQVVAAFPSEARAYQMLADCHLKEGRVERSVEAYRVLRGIDPSSAPLIANRLRSLLAADPNNDPARQLMELVCIEAGDLQEAVPLLRRRLRRGGDDAREAIDRLRQMLLASPTDASLRKASAEACLVLDEPAAAWGYLRDLVREQQAAEADLLHLIVLCAGSSVDLFRTISSHVSSLPSRWVEQPEVVFALAESACRAGLFREAVDGYRRAGSLAPEAASICQAAIRSLGVRASEIGQGEDAATLAEALLDVGETTAATEVLHRVVEISSAGASRLDGRLTELLRKDPGHLALNGALARICLASGQTARALSIARGAVAGREDMDSAPIMMIYGDALARSGRPAEAIRAYAATVKRDPSLAGEIIRRLQKVIQVDMGLEAAHLTLGRLLINEGRVAEGVHSLMSAWSVKADLGPAILKDLEQTARRYPAEPAVDLGRAKLLLEAGDPGAAASALGARCGEAEPGILDEILARLEGIVARHPECARAQLELGGAYLAKGLAARACASLLRAYEQDRSLAELIAMPLARIQEEFPDEPEAHIARIALYEGEGRPVPAEVHLMLVRACRLSRDVSGCIAAARRVMGAGGDHAAQLRAEMDDLVAGEPLSAVVRLARASACIRVADMEAASRDLGEALRLDRSCSDSVIELAREILQRRPRFMPGAVVLANAMMAAGDDAGACRALDDALVGLDAACPDVDLILWRRGLALKAGDDVLACDLLARAEAASPDREQLLERLHRDALASAGSRHGAPALPPAASEAMGRGEYFRASEIMSGAEASCVKAWILERCGRWAEAAACLQEIIADGRAAARFASLHDDLVMREMEGRAPALMAETRLQFEIKACQTGTVQGGV